MNQHPFEVFIVEDNDTEVHLTLIALRSSSNETSVVGDKDAAGER